MVEPLRHRQTKEAETDMFSLQPPRHIPTTKGRRGRQADGTAGLPPASEIAHALRHLRFVPKGDMRELRHLILHGLV